MSARRRRIGSESEAAPIVIVTDRNTNDTYDKHAGKLKQYSNGSQTTLERTLAPREIALVPEAMAARDRTEEFQRMTRNMQDKQITSAGNVRDPTRRSAHAQGHTEFMSIARTIGSNIASTYVKLEKLTDYAKDLSNFDDKTGKIQELTYMIKVDLGNLNQQIAKLQEVAKNQKQGQKNGKRHLQSHSSNVVLALQSKLASMSTDFKKALDVRTETLNKKQSKLEEYSQSVVQRPLLPGASRGETRSVLEEHRINMEKQEGGHGSEHDRAPLLQSQQHLYDDQTESYLQSRAETMQNIESTIVELGGIFQQLAGMVKEQEEMVDRIDTHVESAALDVDAAHSELIRYFQSVTSNRWLMLKIFGVLIFFFVFFVVFMT